MQETYKCRYYCEETAGRIVIREKEPDGCGGFIDIFADDGIKFAMKGNDETLWLMVDTGQGIELICLWTRLSNTLRPVRADMIEPIIESEGITILPNAKGLAANFSFDITPLNSRPVPAFEPIGIEQYENEH